MHNEPSLTLFGPEHRRGSGRHPLPVKTGQAAQSSSDKQFTTNQTNANNENEDSNKKAFTPLGIKIQILASVLPWK